VTVLNQKIGFIGAGNMAEAFVGALIRSGIFSAEMVFASDVNRERLAVLHHKYAIASKNQNKDLFDSADIIVLAVKPQQLKSVLSEISQNPDYKITSRKLVISIAAGISIDSIERLLYAPLDDRQKTNLPIVRVMPNTPALVLSGMSGMSCNKNCRDEDVHTTRTLLAAMGKVIEFKEQDLDAVTALSGSGPAYVYYFIEAMIDAGVELGIRFDEAALLTVETFKGALKLLEDSSETPETLRRKVTSPGGTTEAALSVFEKREVKKHLIEGILRAAARSKELSGA
jgi:pyrroline-5-carboxylate reductase